MLTGAFIFPQAPKAGQSFTLWLTGSAITSATAQIVISGPSCPATCVVNPSYRSTTLLSANTTLSTKGAHTIAIRNGPTGTLSATRPLTIQ